jgi:hypothetical protein
MAAQAVRKESKTASKALLFKVGKTLMGRLSHIRHKDKQKSRSSANGFVSGIQVSFADSQTNSLSNHVLSANGLNNVISVITRVFKAGGFKGKCLTAKAEFSLISATSNRKIYTPLAGSKLDHFGYIFWRRNISRGNDKLFCFFCNFDRKFLIGALDAIVNSDGDSHITNSIDETLGFELVTVHQL